jgi:hypothetical protein
MPPSDYTIEVGGETIVFDAYEPGAKKIVTLAVPKGDSWAITATIGKIIILNKTQVKIL